MAIDKRPFRYLTPTAASSVPASTTAPRLDDEARQRIEDALREGRSPSTWRAYASAWNSGFVPWCEAQGYAPVPSTSEVVAAYLTDRAEDLAVPTLEVHLAAICAAHEVLGIESPTRHPLVKGALKGLRRRQRTRRPRQSKAMTHEMLDLMLRNMPGGDLAVARSRAVVAVTWWGALRRSETVALNWSDVTFEPTGIRILIQHAKTDQEGQGVVLGLPRSGDSTCPATALAAWRDASGLVEGPVFVAVDRWDKLGRRRLTAQSVALVLKRAAAAAGLDAAVISGHSGRRGFITEAAANGVPEQVIARHSRHRSMQTLRGYIEDAEVMEKGAAMVLARSL